MGAPTSSIPAVSAKNLALTNDVALDVKKLEVEDAEIAKEIAANPSRPDLVKLNSRRGAIATAKANHE